MTNFAYELRLLSKISRALNNGFDIESQSLDDGSVILTANEVVIRYVVSPGKCHLIHSRDGKTVQKLMSIHLWSALVNLSNNRGYELASIEAKKKAILQAENRLHESRKAHIQRVKVKRLKAAGGSTELKAKRHIRKIEQEANILAGALLIVEDIRIGYADAQKRLCGDRYWACIAANPRIKVVFDMMNPVDYQETLEILGSVASSNKFEDNISDLAANRIVKAVSDTLGTEYAFSGLYQFRNILAARCNLYRSETNRKSNSLLRSSLPKLLRDLRYSGEEENFF